MTALKIGIIGILFFFQTISFASVRPGFTGVGPLAIRDTDVTFSYISNDGSIQLKCDQYFADTTLNDWDVWCGKGTNMFRQFRVHFLVRQYQSKVGEKSAFEILYWIIDRKQPSVTSETFKSNTTWIQFRNLSDLDLFTLSQGVENDYAYLVLSFKPTSSLVSKSATLTDKNPAPAF
jgi:hypothetical protein